MPTPIHNLKQKVIESNDPYILKMWEEKFVLFWGDDLDQCSPNVDTFGNVWTVRLKNSQTYQVVTKYQRNSFSKWTGILLEQEIWRDKNVPSSKFKDGWIEAPCSADYLFYMSIVDNMCYPFPWSQLQRAYRTNKAEWMSRAKQRLASDFNKVAFSYDYRVVCAQNDAWWGYSLVVPIKTIQEATGVFWRLPGKKELL